MSCNMDTSPSKWFSIGFPFLTNGTFTLELNGVLIPVIFEFKDDPRSNPLSIVTPMALEWLTLPNGHNLATGLDFMPLSLEEGSSLYYFVNSENGQALPGFSFATILPECFDDGYDPDEVCIEGLVAAAKRLGAASLKDVEGIDPYTLFQEAYGFHPKDMGGELRCYYSHDVSMVLDFPRSEHKKWEWMGTMYWPFDIEDWQWALETIVSYTGNYALLDSVDLEAVRDEYIAINEI